MLVFLAQSMTHKCCFTFCSFNKYAPGCDQPAATCPGDSLQRRSGVLMLLTLMGVFTPGLLQKDKKKNHLNTRLEQVYLLAST